MILNSLIQDSAVLRVGKGIDLCTSSYSGFASDCAGFVGQPTVYVEAVLYILSKVPTEAANWWEYRKQAARFNPEMPNLVVIFNT